MGISVDANPYEPHLLGGTMAHMIGHNIGMDHDDGRKYCSNHKFLLAKIFFFFLSRVEKLRLSNWVYRFPLVRILGATIINYHSHTVGK